MCIYTMLCYIRVCGCACVPDGCVYVCSAGRGVPRWVTKQNTHSLLTAVTMAGEDCLGTHIGQPRAMW